jgi:hypothetical protein
MKAQHICTQIEKRLLEVYDFLSKQTCAPVLSFAEMRRVALVPAIAIFRPFSCSELKFKAAEPILP